MEEKTTAHHKLYTEEEMEQKVREAIHPHPHSYEPSPSHSRALQQANERTLTTRHSAETRIMVPKRNIPIEGLEDLTLEEDLILPRWRIVQYSSTIKGQPGQFNSNLDEELRNKLDLIVLKITPSRAYFNDDRELVCASNNGHVSTRGQQCINCPDSLWGEDGEPPLCSRGYTLICLDPQDDSLCLIGALRTSVPGMKRYNSLLVKRKQPPFAFLTRFTAEDQVSPKGKYFILNIDLLGENAPDKIAEYRQQYQALANVNIVEVEEPPIGDDFDDEYESRPLPF